MEVVVSEVPDGRRVQAMRKTKTMRVAALLMTVALLGAGSVLVAQDADKANSAKSEVTGIVAMACPEGKQITIHTDDGQKLTFPVMNEAGGAVKALKKGDKVKLTLFVCPKTKKSLVQKVENA